MFIFMGPFVILCFVVLYIFLVILKNFNFIKKNKDIWITIINMISKEVKNNNPKSLPNLERVYLDFIENSYEGLDIDLLKEKVVNEFVKIINNEEVLTNEKVKKQINNKYTHIKIIHINEIVICNYNHRNNIIYFALSFSYYNNDKIEDKIILEYKLNKQSYLSNCPNCGAPVDNYKICSYCKSPLNINYKWELYKIKI